MSFTERLVSTGAARILVIDAERISGLARVWDQTPRFLPAGQWTRLPSLLCFAWQWYGHKPVHTAASWDGHRAMLQKAWDLYDEADVIVTYNGRRADNVWLRGEWAVADMPPPKPWRDVDLFVMSKQFGYESRSLAHLCHRLGVDGKHGHYDPVVAEKALEGDPAAQRSILRYNRADVRATTGVYDRLRPHLRQHPNLGLWHADGARRCPQCGSTDLGDAGYVRTALTTYAAYRCAQCGAVSRANYVKGRVDLRAAT